LGCAGQCTLQLRIDFLRKILFFSPEIDHIRQPPCDTRFRLSRTEFDELNNEGL
jgi:hypothetical protein